MTCEARGARGARAGGREVWPGARRARQRRRAERASALRAPTHGRDEVPDEEDPDEEEVVQRVLALVVGVIGGQVGVQLAKDDGLRDAADEEQRPDAQRRRALLRKVACQDHQLVSRYHGADLVRVRRGGDEVRAGGGGGGRAHGA